MPVSMRKMAFSGDAIGVIRSALYLSTSAHPFIAKEINVAAVIFFPQRQL